MRNSNFDRSFRRMNTFIKMWFVLVAVLALGGITVSAFLSYKCYMGGDPNSMACFMISDRVEVGVRQR